MSMQIERELQRAEQLMSIGQIDGAIDVYRRVLTEDPDLAEAHARLAICLLRRRRLYAAKIEADMAMTLEPEALLSHWVGAEISIANRDFRRAEGHIERLLALAPDEPYFYLLQARLMDLTGKSKQRLPVLERALECGPNDPEVLADLADYHRAEGDLDTAERYAREALGVSAEHSSALVAMGHIELNRGNVETARELALAALQNNPEATNALHLLTAVKARSSFALGLWWRYATWGLRVGPTRNIIVLLVAFIVYRVLLIATDEAGASGAAGIISILWLGIVVYSFIGPVVFQRALKKEFESVALKRF